MRPFDWIVVVAYIGWIAFRRKPLRIRQWEFELPSPSLFFGQIAISIVDWVIAAGVLYILLPDTLPLQPTNWHPESGSAVNVTVVP